MVAIRHAILSTFLLLLCASTASYATQIQVTVDRNPVAINESFQLIFSTTASPDGKPDFSPLAKDFDIENQQQRNQSSWTNGTSTSSIQWELTLIPKKSGAIAIPAIQFGDDASASATITVTDGIQLDGETNKEMFLNVEASSLDSYVQSQIIYTVRFYQRIRILEAGLSVPKVSDAIIEELAESQFKTTIDGNIYLVTERKYAIFPQQSGMLIIPPLDLTVRVANSQQNNYYGGANTQIKKLKSEAITLNINPIPTALNDKNWLAAEQLTLHDSWSNDDISVNVGDAITRTITLDAKGVMPSQLPEIPVKDTDNQLKSYPDKATSSDQKDGNGFTSVRVQKIAFIPSSSGQYKLPAIEIPWFNLQTQKMDVAVLPAVTLTAVTTNSSTNKTPVSNDAAFVNPIQNTKEKNTGYFWQGLSLLFAMLWLATLFYLFKVRTKGVTLAPIANKPIEISNTALFKEVKNACQNNDPQKCQNAFIQWAKQHYGTANLSDIKQSCTTELKQCIDQLQLHLYSEQSNNWDNNAFLQAFIANNKQHSTSSKKDDALNALHKL